MNTYPDIIRQVIADKLGFTFKNFQLEDYARAALHDGIVLGHDTGGGKTIALYVLPALKCGFDRTVKRLAPLKPVLIVAPGDLHEQTMQEGTDHFKAIVTPIDTQETFLQLSEPNPAGGARQLPPGYYITTYQQLASNGVKPFPPYDPANWLGLMQTLGLTELDAVEFFNQRGVIFKRQYARLNVQPHFSPAMLLEAKRMALMGAGDSIPQQREIESDYLTLARLTPARGHEYSDLDDDQQEWVLQGMVARKHTEYNQSVGSSRWVKPPAAAVDLKRIEGRAGEDNEFVEFTVTGETMEDESRRFIAQKNGARYDSPAESWTVFKAVGDDVEVVKSFPEKQQAVDHAEQLAFDEAPDSAPGTPHSELKIKCVYDPSLADWCQDSFACVCVDEGVTMKGEVTEVGLGIRQMNPPYKFVLSATPIKNRLPDAFRLAWWACGGRSEAHARFPYPDSAAAREAFAAEFLISERNLTKEQKAKNSRFKKLTPQVCNIHRLWKLFAPVILRRRKKDFGEDIVTKTRHVVRAPMGAEQAAVYKFHLDANYLDKNGLPAIGAQLQALRIAAANPCSLLLKRPEGDGKTKGDPRSNCTHIPKLHAAFKLIVQILQRGEQVVIFSAFNDSLDVLQARLQEAGVKHCLLDGRTSPKKRAHAAKLFKHGPPKAGGKSVSPYPVMLAGVECMAEGHSFHLCNNVILLAYSWAYDKFEQAINRVHRLNSRWDVNVYPIICDGSIDRRLEAGIQEKGDAAELVLDGKLLAENHDEVSLAELLSVARAEFNGKTVVDEKELEKDWPPLRLQLGRAQQGWGRDAWMADLGSARVTRANETVPVEQSPVVEVAATVTATVAAPTPRPTMVRPAIKQPVVTAFDEMPLWSQSAAVKKALPPRPSPFARRA
jgi:hypothetical protein